MGDPHACRTHATAMWEGGMWERPAEDSATPGVHRIYTRVSDPAVVADYTGWAARPNDSAV